MTEIERWANIGRENGWTMPPAPWWKRLPAIRHVRAIYGNVQVERWYRYGPGAFGIRTGYDNWVLVGMWHGLEPSP